MKKKELLLEVFSSPLIQNLIKQGFMTKEQLVEFVLYETVDDDDLPIDPAVDPPEEEEEEEETPEMPAINQPGHDMKMIRLAAKMAIQAGVKILKILKKIDIAIKFETVIDATGVPVRKIPDDLKTSLEPEEVKKYEQLKLKLDGIQNKLDPHLTLKNNQVDKAIIPATKKGVAIFTIEWGNHCEWIPVQQGKSYRHRWLHKEHKPSIESR